MAINMDSLLLNEAKSLYEKAKEYTNQKTPDYAAALDCLLEAHRQGLGSASYALGSWYFHGRQVDKDIKRSVKYWEIGSDRQNIESIKELAKYYENEEFCSQNMSKVLGLYIRAALLGDAPSMYEVGRIFYYGIGVNQDKYLGGIWLDAAEERGYSMNDDEL